MATFSVQKEWPLKTGLTVLSIFMTHYTEYPCHQEYPDSDSLPWQKCLDNSFAFLPLQVPSINIQRHHATRNVLITHSPSCPYRYQVSTYGDTMPPEMSWLLIHIPALTGTKYQHTATPCHLGCRGHQGSQSDIPSISLVDTTGMGTVMISGCWTWGAASGPKWRSSRSWRSRVPETSSWLGSMKTGGQWQFIVGVIIAELYPLGDYFHEDMFGLMKAPHDAAVYCACSSLWAVLYSFFSSVIALKQKTKN